MQPAEVVGTLSAPLTRTAKRREGTSDSSPTSFAMKMFFAGTLSPLTRGTYYIRWYPISSLSVVPQIELHSMVLDLRGVSETLVEFTCFSQLHAERARRYIGEYPVAGMMNGTWRGLRYVPARM